MRVCTVNPHFYDVLFDFLEEQYYADSHIFGETIFEIVFVYSNTMLQSASELSHRLRPFWDHLGFNNS